MKNKLIDFFKGFLLGLDSTIPGFSMGTLAILLKIYDRMIEDFSDALKHPIKFLKKDFFMIIGLLVGLVANILSISYLLSHFPLQAVCFFVGLVLCSIPPTFSEVKKYGIKFKEVLCFVVAIGVLVFVTLLNAGESQEITFSPLSIVMMIVVGSIGSGTMIIPGVSGSMIIMALGYWEPVMQVMSNVIKFNDFAVNATLFACFLIGVVLGLVLVSKLIRFLQSKSPSAVYSAILGLLVGSPFAMIYLTSQKYEIDFTNPWVYITSVIMLALGIIAGIFINKQEKKNQEYKEEIKKDECLE